MADEVNTNLIKMEHDVLKFWDDNDCFGKLRKRNEGNKRFRFLDGPITANNPMGIHHAWGRSLKDIFIRYHAMKGYDCRYQNGFDSQGLWVEVGVEKDLGFKSKRDIEKYGIDKFTRACEDRVKKYSSVITEQSKRLGQWMDWDNSYFTNTDENIQGIWYFLKKCDDNGWIEQEYKPMPWCPRCGTSLSEHEMTGSYKMITHNSVFFKLPLVEQDKKILVWTTTPWTLSSNAALAVNPEIDYVEVKIKSDDKPIYLAKNAIKYLGDDKLEVVRGLKGSELVGLHYETCFPEFEKQQGVDHKIVAWEDVAADEGTGVVHIAPGCGLEDFQLGQREGISLIMPVDDLGIFLPGFGFMTGKDSHTIAQEVFDELEKRNKLYKIMPINHSYPVCWRCKSEVIFRCVPAWYIRTEELKPRLIKAANTVKWEPEANGKRMVDWLTNMGDWNISRKRYYGLPLPFYHCECGHTTVVGSKEELRKLAVDPKTVDDLPELHRPWIDNVKIRCPKCGREVSRIPDIGDVWMDAGIVPFTTLGYFKDKEEWKKNFPAEWITEMREQVRLWWYAMLFMSVVIEDRAPYERTLGFNSVVAEDGSKFSKTGFMIKFDEAAEKIGADTIRYMYAGAPITNDVRFGYNLGDEARRKLLSFMNIYTFFETYASIDKPDLTNFTPDVNKMTLIDKWLVLRTNQFADIAEKYLDDYKTYPVVKEFETFVDDVSNWYIRTNRRRFWKTENGEDKMTAYWTLKYALITSSRCMAPIIPFMTEYIWQNVERKVNKNAEISVHLSGWPEKFDKVVDDTVLENTKVSREVISVAMRLRNEKQLKVRQPLSTIYICCGKETEDKIKNFEKNILDELNIRNIVYTEDKSVLEENYLTVNFKKAGAVLKKDVNKMKQTLLDLSAEEMKEKTEKVKAGEKVTFDGWDGEYDPELFTVESRPKNNIASAEFSEGALGLDTNLTDELIRDGVIRDVIRQCQLARKEAGFDVNQRILISINSDDSGIVSSLNGAEEKLSSELLADSVTIGSDIEGDFTKVVGEENQNIKITVKKS